VPHAWGATVSAYNLPPISAFPQRRQQLTRAQPRTYGDCVHGKYV